AIFPSADDLGTGGYYTDILYTIQNNDDLPLLSAYVPVNLQPDVPGTTFYDRRPNAPAGSTCLQIVGKKMSGTIMKDMVTYQINLGLNFAENYSLPGNYHLNYTIRLKGVSDEDPHVVKLIPGYFGGGMKAWNAAGTEVSVNANDAVKWRYANRIEVYPEDAPNISKFFKPTDNINNMPYFYDEHCEISFPALVTNNNLVDGYLNTCYYFKSELFIPAYCIVKGLYDGILEIYQPTDWYWPSIMEMTGIWISGEAFIKDMSSSYWSSSAHDYSTAYMIDSYGGVYARGVCGRNYVRAVRQINY
ncbi:hypothetical protein NMU02_13545, partial [Coprobacter sp. LH1063]|nr:hypothetical protein [Coprobacter tertius]